MMRHITFRSLTASTVVGFVIGVATSVYVFFLLFISPPVVALYMGPFYGLIHFNKSVVWVPLIAMALTFALFSGLAEARFRVIGSILYLMYVFLFIYFQIISPYDRLPWVGLFTNWLATGLIWPMLSPFILLSYFYLRRLYR